MVEMLKPRNNKYASTLITCDKFVEQEIWEKKKKSKFLSNLESNIVFPSVRHGGGLARWEARIGATAMRLRRGLYEADGPGGLLFAWFPRSGPLWTGHKVQTSSKETFFDVNL